MRRIGFFQNFVNAWPGRKRFGVYRFLPIFFAIGAVLEFSMINWRVGQVNFYTTFRRRQAEEQAKTNIEQRLAHLQVEETNSKKSEASAE